MTADDLPPDVGFDGLVARIAGDARGRARYLVGIAGPPGGGKSTLAARLAVAVDAVVVPMDGFHLDNAELERRGRRAVKGAPDTFDAAGFVTLVRRLRDATEPITAPSFDRHADGTVADAIVVPPDVVVVIAEGNYLLLDQPPWHELRDLLDLVAYVDVDDAARVERLVARHVEHGRSAAEAREFVLRSDEANAVLVAAGRHRADVLVDPFGPTYHRPDDRHDPTR